MFNSLYPSILTIFGNQSTISLSGQLNLTDFKHLDPAGKFNVETEPVVLLGAEKGES